MRIAAVSDLHGHLPDVPECDLLLLAGDLVPATRVAHTTRAQAEWLDGPFRRWLAAVPARKVVGVAGNHDRVFQDAPHLVPPDLRWLYLQDTGATAAGLRVYGTPWQPVFYDWAFNADEATRRAKWAMIPPDTQVLVLHGPPHGSGDLAPRHGAPADDRAWPGGERVGCKALAARLAALPALRLAVFGHIHSGRGVYAGPNGATLANVAHVGEDYLPAHPVMLFEVPDAAADGWWRHAPQNREYRPAPPASPPTHAAPPVTAVRRG